MYSFVLTPKAKTDMQLLKKERKSYTSKVLELIVDISDGPFEGIGKPKQLTGDMKKCYSRKISDKHRLIYRVELNTVIIISMYGHYSDK